jgi:hypothetical protein
MRIPVTRRVMKRFMRKLVWRAMNKILMGPFKEPDELSAFHLDAMEARLEGLYPFEDSRWQRIAEAAEKLADEVAAEVKRRMSREESHKFLLEAELLKDFACLPKDINEQYYRKFLESSWR